MHSTCVRAGMHEECDATQRNATQRRPPPPVFFNGMTIERETERKRERNGRAVSNFFFNLPRDSGFDTPRITRAHAHVRTGWTLARVCNRANGKIRNKKKRKKSIRPHPSRLPSEKMPTKFTSPPVRSWKWYSAAGWRRKFHGVPRGKFACRATFISPSCENGEFQQKDTANNLIRRAQLSGWISVNICAK